MSIRDVVASYSGRGLLATHGLVVALEAPVRVDRPVRVRVSLQVPDSTDPTRTVTVSRTGVASVAHGRVEHADVDRAAWSALIELLAHEAGECLLRDGVPLYDPHELPRVWPWRTE